jgi:AMMECR1 domain-containing protein
MSRSVLLQLARDSIEEVLQAQNSIDKQALLTQHPLLNEKVPTTVKLYIDGELRASCEQSSEQKSLLDEIIIKAKKAAFEDASSSPISTSEYLHCEIELTLETEDGVISERDPAILKSST